MSSLSSRVFAELLDLPAYKQARILAEQKHPRCQPQVFRVPYYASALKGIRDFYRDGRTSASLQRTRASLLQLSPESRREHNLPVLDLFETSSQKARPLQLLPLKCYRTRSGSVDITVRFDLAGTESGRSRYIFFNTRVAAIDKETADTTLEIAHWVMQRDGNSVALSDLEYVDLVGGKIFRRKQQRKTTIAKMRSNIRVIDALWPTL